VKLSSIDKCFQIIEILHENRQSLRLSEISSMLDLHPSTAHHMLNTLLPRNYIAQCPETKKYSLGFRFLEISRGILDNMDIRNIARKHLEELHKESREAIHLAVLKNKKVLYIDKINNPSGLSLATYIGFVTDPHATAGGKVLLAGLSANEVSEIYENRPLKAFGKRTITSLSKLLENLENIRKQGYAIDDEEYSEGVRCVAAPIRAGGQVEASLSITGSIFTITIDRIEGELKDLVMEKAKRISSQLS
jgi:IclR family KDG regulon transcriptional repressor